MSLEENTEDQDPTKFILKSKAPGRTNEGFQCQGTSKEERDEWVQSIRAILDTQRDFLRALQSPIAYQKELNKDMYVSVGVNLVKKNCFRILLLGIDDAVLWNHSSIHFIWLS